jgi:hypothetical protein
MLGLSLPVLLTILFVVLKVARRIDWGWVWVLCPLWISLVLKNLYNIRC